MKEIAMTLEELEQEIKSFDGLEGRVDSLKTELKADIQSLGERL